MSDDPAQNVPPPDPPAEDPLAALHAGKLSFCRSCPLYDAPGPVFGHGPAQTRLMAVGEAPGEEEAHLGRPFIGGSGRLLTVLLAKAGISRESVYLTNAVKCRPPGNRKPTGEEITCCSVILEQEVKDVDPNCIVALGDTPLNALTYRTGITRWRGIPIAGMGGKKVIGTFHPAYVARAPSNFAYPIFDLQRADGESAFPELRRVETSYIRDGSLEDLETAHQVALDVGFIGYDIETAMTLHPEDGAPICCGFGSVPGKIGCYRWTPHLVNKMKEIFSDERIEKVGQNNEGFDLPYVEWHGCHHKGKVADTLLMFHLVSPDMQKDLETINSFYSDIEPWKHEKKGDLFIYNCKDVDATIRAYINLKKEIASIGLTDFYYNHVAPVQPVIRKMTARGMKKDVDKAIMWSYVLTKRANELEKVLQEGIGDMSFNVNSAPQLKTLLYDTMGLKTQYKKNKNGGFSPTTDSEALEKLALLYPNNEIFKMVMEIRECRKMESTFVSVATDEAGFIHPRFSTAKAATGRFNSFEPNAQNIPKEVREIYIPDTPDHVIWSCDWSQIEGRLKTILSGDKIGLDLLTSGADMHRGTASETLGKRIEDIDDTERDTAKFIVYGLDYGRGVASLYAEARLNPIYKDWSDAKLYQFFEMFVGRYSKKFETYWKWRERNVRFVEKNGFYANPFGRRRYWFSRQITEVYNMPQQSTAADMMYDVIVAIDNDLPAGSTIRLTVHDELVGNTPKDLAKLTKECVEDHMNRKWPNIVEASANPDLVRLYYPNGWHCPADLVFGNNWKESKKGNKALMKELVG